MLPRTPFKISIFYHLVFGLFISSVRGILVGNFTTGVQVIKSPGNYWDAKETCENLNNGPWQLPSIIPRESAFNWPEWLIKEMETVTNSEIWLSLRREVLTGWKNIDNTTYVGRVQENGNARKSCALVKLRYEAAVSDFCESSGYGYICQIKTCPSCPPNISPHNCIRMGENCYILGCDAGSWFEASNRCVAMGTTLATLRSENEVVRLVRKIKRRPHNPCQHFWVGMRKTIWSFQNNQGNESPDLYYWYTNYPSPDHSCATLKKFDVGFYWASSDCQARHEFICMKHVGRYPITITSSTITLPSDEKNIGEKPRSPITNRYPHIICAGGSATIHTSLVLQALILSMFLIVIIIIIGSFIYQRYIKTRLKERCDHLTKADHELTVRLSQPGQEILNSLQK